MKFYRMGHGQSERAPYSPTILSSNPVYLGNCRKCGRTKFNDANKDLNLIIEGKGKMTDYLLCGHYPLMLLSEKALYAWEKAGITGYESFPVKLVDADGAEITRGGKYHNVTITGRAELDFDKMGVAITHVCESCGSLSFNKDTWDFGTSVMREGTHDGTDIFAFKYFERIPICSEKMLEIVFRDKLTGFDFKEYSVQFVHDGSVPYVDLRKMFAKG